MTRTALLLLSGLVLVGAGGIAAAALQTGTAAKEKHARPAAVHYAGWAMEAYPGDGVASLRGEMKRQVRNGANVVWLGHNNPGEVGYGKREPGLSYAVWAAYRDAADPLHRQAVAMVRAQRAAIEAARALGVRVVLAVGYQIQMGDAWNRDHPQDLRRAADGSLYDASGGPNHSASFYAPDYRRDIVTYYHWIDSTFVRPYRHTILMLNLADEPEDGDYSRWADRTFRSHHGYGLFEAGSNPARQEAVGRFESNYIALYAAWSAGQWDAIDPGVRVTMSFCGGYSRYQHEGPDLESIFRLSPANFVVTFDAYPRDGLYDTPLREGDLIALFTLIRTLGYYSAIYHRQLWLWSAANSWGLNEASVTPGHIADAVANALYLVQLARQTGGALQGVAVWNYNVRGQGLYNDSHRLSYDPNLMFARVSARFPLLRALMAAPGGRPDTIILAPNAPVLRTAGAHLALRATDLYRWDALAALARADVSAVVLTYLDGRRMPSVRTAIVLAHQPSDLTASDRGALSGLLARGGMIVASSAVAHDLAAGTEQARIVAQNGTVTAVYRLTVLRGTLLAVQGSPVEELFDDGNAGWAQSIWLQALHRATPAASYRVSDGGMTLLYSIAPTGATMSVGAGQEPARGALLVYDTDGALLHRMRLAGHGSPATVWIAARSYALVLDNGLERRRR